MLKKLASETVVYGLSSIVGRLLNFLLVPFYTHLVFTENKADYGIITDLYAIIAFLMVVFSYRMETAFFRFGSDEKNREAAFSTALTSLLASSLFFVSMLVLFSVPITTNILQYPAEQSTYVILFALILAFDVLAEIPFARLRLEHKAFRFASIKITNIVLNIGFNIFFLLFCPWFLEQESGSFLHSFIEKIYTPDFKVGYILLSNLIASGVSLLLLSPEIGRIKWNFDKGLWQKMFLYSSPLILAGLAGIANEVLDRQLLKYCLPGTHEENMAQIGIYGACYKLAMLMSLFTQAFRYAAEPFFFAQAKNKDSKELYAAVGKYFAIIGILAFLVINFYLDIFQYFVGASYREGLTIVPILLMANLFLGLYYNLSVWYKLSDKTIWGAYIMSIGAIITLVLNIWWIPTMGYIASAWATLICYISVTIISWLLGRKYYSVPYDVKRILGYIFASVILYFISIGVKEYTGFSSSILLLFNTVLLVFFLLALYRLERKPFMKYFN